MRVCAGPIKINGHEKISKSARRPVEACIWVSDALVCTNVIGIVFKSEIQ